MIQKFNEALEFNALVNLANGQLTPINKYIFLNLKPEHFHDKSNQDIYALMLDAYTNQDDFNAIRIAEKIINKDSNTYLRNEKLINSLYNPMYSLNEKDINHLKAMHEYNKMMLGLHKVVNQSVANEGSEADIKSIKAQLLDLTENNVTQTQSGTKLTDLVDELHYSDTKDEFIKTGINDLDSYLGGGFLKGTLAALVAEPGVGKTYYGMHLVDEILQANPGTHGLFFSVEMKKKRLYPRFIALKAKKFFDKCSQKEKDDAGFELKLMDLTIYDSADEPDCANVEFIRLTSILESKRKPISVILIDYLTILQVRKNIEQEHLRIGEVVRQLMPLAMQLNCVIIVLVHSNRNAQNRNPYDRAPTQFDEASSQASFRSSDYWIGLDKPIRHVPEDKRVKDIFTLRCVKNRSFTDFYINTRFENGTFSKNYYLYEPSVFSEQSSISWK